MKINKLAIASCLLFLSVKGNAQEVNRKLYQDYEPLTNYILLPKYAHPKKDTEQRPDHVDNSKLKFYPPVFCQDGGSCGSASNEGYNFTYEMNSLRNVYGSQTRNQYPSHWIYLFAYQHSDREEILLKNGIPNVRTYGGRTYSKTLGNQDCSDADNGRMQGYDKWLSAMYNRIERTARFRSTLMTEEGREDLKNWIWNHQGDTAFYAGGVACVGVAITGCKTGKIPLTNTNRSCRIVGQEYIKSWGETFDHSVTIVGYDDRIEFDLDGDGVIGEKDEDECGAWIICNSWGDGWANGGFIYCPYKYGVSVGKDRLPMTPGRFIIRKNYSPERVFRIAMEYTHRSELQLVAGVSENLNATSPTYTTVMSMFNYDGNPDNVTPVPEIPMLGRWADGKLHKEPMEFGFDVTDLTKKVDKAKPLKYFLKICSASSAIGSGKVHEFTLMNYENGTDSVEGLQVGTETVDIKNGGKTTYVTLIVPGLGNHRPNSPQCRSHVLSWKAPEASEFELDKYYIYVGGELRDSTESNVLSYTLPENEEEYLQVTAVYKGKDGIKIESKKSDVVSPLISTVTSSVKFTCDLDGTYLGHIRYMLDKYRLGGLDLSKARIVEGGDCYAEGFYSDNDIIGEELFCKCNKLHSIELPESTNTIGKRAFSNCEGLTKIVVPDQVRTMGYDSFAYCPKLTTATIGSHVETFEQGVFWNSGVKTIYAKPLTPPTLANYPMSSNPTIHVYSDALDAYKASDWAKYGKLVGDLDTIIPREEDAIQQIAEKSIEEDRIYDLEGRFVPTVSRSGLYIVNGKKCFIKK